jgi:hypothetical protein
MIKASAMTTNAPQTLAEARLWQAVILTTVQDWLSGPLRLKREAEQYLFGEDSDFRLVCESAGMDIGRIRSRLIQLRTRRSTQRCAVPA